MGSDPQGHERPTPAVDPAKAAKAEETLRTHLVTTFVRLHALILAIAGGTLALLANGLVSHGDQLLAGRVRLISATALLLLSLLCLGVGMVAEITYTVLAAHALARAKKGHGGTPKEYGKFADAKPGVAALWVFVKQNAATYLFTALSFGSLFLGLGLLASFGVSNMGRTEDPVMTDGEKRSDQPKPDVVGKRHVFHLPIDVAPDQEPPAEAPTEPAPKPDGGGEGHDKPSE
jgi:hypothetical protein